MWDGCATDQSCQMAGAVSDCQDNSPRIVRGYFESFEVEEFEPKAGTVALTKHFPGTLCRVFFWGRQAPDKSLTRSGHL